MYNFVDTDVLSAHERERAVETPGHWAGHHRVVRPVERERVAEVQEHGIFRVSVDDGWFRYAIRIVSRIFIDSS